MRSGALYTVADLAVWMRVDREEVERMIAEDGLPTVTLAGDKRPKVKIAPRHLCDWLNGRSTVAWRIDDLIADIDRVLMAEARRRNAKREEVKAA